MDCDDVSGVFSTVQARLIKSSSSVADDRDKARFVLSIGADYWPASNDFQSEIGAYYLPSVGSGRHKFVTTEWRSFNFHTMFNGTAPFTESELQSAGLPTLD